MLSEDYINTFLFGIYPYLCLAVLLIGSLIRFDREPYTWKSVTSNCSIAVVPHRCISSSICMAKTAIVAKPWLISSAFMSRPASS